MAGNDQVGTLTRVRRSLEVRWGWRVVFAAIPAAVGVALIMEVGVVGIVAGAVLVAIALAIFALPIFGPEHQRRRLLASARDRGDRGGWVTLEGVATAAGELLAAPYSETRCIAYWARSVMADSENDSHDAGLDSAQRMACIDFTLEVDGVRVHVTSMRAQLVFDRGQAEIVSGAGTHDRREEILLRAGERVVVRGILVREANRAQLGRATIALGG